MEDISEDRRLLLAGVCLLGLECKLQTWFSGGEDLKKTLSKTSWGCFFSQNLLQKAWSCCTSCPGPSVLTAARVMFSIKQSCCVPFPGKKLPELRLACAQTLPWLSLCGARTPCAQGEAWPCVLGISWAAAGRCACATAGAAELLFPPLVCSALMATALLLASEMLLSQAP